MTSTTLPITDISKTCTVCIEKYNKSTHSRIICKYCEYNVCSSCCETYLLTVNTAQCMNCRNGWLREFLNNNFKKTFLNKTLKDHHKSYLFDIEKSLLPLSMIEVEKQKQINELNALVLIQKQIIIDAQRKMIDLRNDIYRLHHNINNPIENTNVETPELRFIRNCPQDECRGFLSTQWKCGLCSIWVCPDCNKVKNGKNDTEHVCNKDDIETQKVLTLNTKTCPSCAVPIFKIDGCNQMWCTNCHVAFNWNTKKIEANVHNPHYFEWMRLNNNNTLQRNPLDFRCGRQLDHNFTRDFTQLTKNLEGVFARELKKKNIISIENGENYINTNIQFKEYYDRIYISIRNIIHILYDEIPNYNINREISNSDLRIRYLLNEIDEKQLKTTICSRETRLEKNREIRDILTMFVHSSTDIIYRIFENGNLFINNNNIKLDFLIGKELLELIKYVNENLYIIHKTYNTTTYLQYTNICGIDAQNTNKKIKK